MALNTVTLTFTLQDAADDAGAGGVAIAPTSVVTAAGVTVVSAAPVVRAFSGGTASVQLVANDNTGTSPAAGFWAYEITLPGGNPGLYLVNFANGATQRFDSLTPVVALTTYGPAAAGAVTSVFGRTGTVTAQTGDYTPSEVGAVAKAGDTMTGELSPAVITLTDAATIAIDADDGNDFRCLLTSAVGGTRAVGAPSNPADGQQVVLALTQPASGGPCVVTWNSVFAFGTTGAPTLTVTASATDLIGFKYYGGSVAKWRCTGSALGF